MAVVNYTIKKEMKIKPKEFGDKAVGLVACSRP